MVQNIRTLGLPTLIGFHTVAKTGGISAAAEELGMAKSGISRHVALLEDHLGVKLLERGARSVSLTPIGELLDQKIGSVLAEIDLMEDIAREERIGVSGQVNIAATPDFGALVATKLFPLARERYPDLTVVMQPEYGFADMQGPGIDIALRIVQAHDDRLVAKEMGTFRRVLVASPELLKNHNIKHPSDLAGLPCLTFRGDRPGAIWKFETASEEVAVSVSGPLAVHNFHILLDLVEAGLGFGLIPEFMLDKKLASGKIVRCLPGYRARTLPVYLTFRPGARRVARIDAAIKLCEEIVPQILSRKNALS